MSKKSQRFRRQHKHQHHHARDNNTAQQERSTKDDLSRSKRAYRFWLCAGLLIVLLCSDINWEEHHFTVIAEKTGRRRVVPVGPKLYQLLLDAFDQAEEGEKRICPISQYGLWRNFQVYLKRAGLERWKDAFKVLRRNCETDWAQKYPQYAVSTWIGHDIQVSARHYLQVPAELYKKVATTNEVETGTKTGTNCRMTRHQKMGNFLSSVRTRN